MIFGYARVSTKEQNWDLQLDALKEKGCERIFKEKISGMNKNRPDLSAMIDMLRKGDTVYVWSLDRLGRSVYEVIRTVATIGEKGARLFVLSENIDTEAPTGKVFVTVFALLAELETNLRRQRQLAGIEAAKYRGVQLGRKKGLSPDAQKKAKDASKLYLSQDPAYSVREICRILNISARTLYRYLDFINVPRKNKFEE